MQSSPACSKEKKKSYRHMVNRCCFVSVMSGRLQKIKKNQSGHFHSIKKVMACCIQLTFQKIGVYDMGSLSSSFFLVGY
jgi:hypothetical protein